MSTVSLPVVLFGYDSSPFTQKVRLALRIKQIPYTFVVVPSMMPRQVLRDAFHLTYRKIPVLAIGREVYCDTSLIIEALENTFTKGHPTLYPLAADGRSYRPLIRGFASYWTDRPLFRVATGLIPSSVWRTSFGVDRAELIGHKLDADKLEAKLPQNLANLDLHLSILEPHCRPSLSTTTPFIFPAPTPSLADLSLFYQLSWALDISAGRGISNLTNGGTSDTSNPGASLVFNPTRYPTLHAWYTAVQTFISHLPSTETNKTTNASPALQSLRAWNHPSTTTTPASDADAAASLLPTPNKAFKELDQRIGLVLGAAVAVAPDDTGRDDPTLGTLLALSPEEVVIKPAELLEGGEVVGGDEDGGQLVNVRLHFPRLGFVVRPTTRQGQGRVGEVGGAKL